jgi:hypothetical protein
MLRAEAAREALGVILTLPRGSVEPRAAVTVVFDRPVVAIGTADPTLEAGRRILSIHPEPEGHYRWLGTRTLSFVVPRGLTRATLYRATLRSRFTALDGSHLDRDSTWAFVTPGPRLIQSFPGQGARLIRPGEPIVLAFDQPVDPKEVARHAGLTGVERFEASRPDPALLDSWDTAFVGSPLTALSASIPGRPWCGTKHHSCSIPDLHGTEGRSRADPTPR